MLKAKKINRPNDFLNNGACSTSAGGGGSGSGNNNSAYLASANTNFTDLVTFEYDINDLRLSARNILTKGQTHDEITQYSGVSVSTRGRYIAPSEKSNNVHGRPLYLFIQAASKENLDLAIQKIEEIIRQSDQQHQPNTTSIPSKMSKFMNRPPPQTQVMSAPQPASTFVEKIMVGLDHAPPAFDLRGQLIGAGGANLHYIRNETGAIATLRGRGSLFIDPTLGTESPEAMHLYIEHPRFEGLQAAKQLAKNLIETLQQELMHYQQINPPVPTVQYTSQPAVLQTQPQSIPQMSVPPPMMAVPPPIIQQNGLEHLNNTQPIMQQQHFITQNAPSIVQSTQPGQPQAQQAQPQPQMIQHQAMLPVSQTVPIHLHPGNVVIQQQVQHAPMGNVSIPPPGIIPVKQGPVVHFQGPPPPVHLSQPPPNIQLQPPQTAQIVLNQPPQNYQYQYIQQSQIQANDVAAQSNQVTIQHIYQPQQQLQGIVQQTSQPTAQFNQFAQQIRPQQLQPGQQYIVQGNTAYMVPPPNLIQQQAQAPQAQNIIFQTQQPQQIQQIPLQQIHQCSQHQPGAELNNVGIIQQSHPSQTNGTGTGIDDAGSVKDDNNKGSPEQHDDSSNKNELKTEIKSEADNLNATAEMIHTSNQQMRQQIVQHQQPPPISQITTQIPPPPVIAASVPPISCVQHIVGNTLISTSQPAVTQTHQIYNQIPVSIQQIAAAAQQQQIVSTQNGQHFLVNAQQWPTAAQPTQFQQVSANNNIQSFHLTTATGHPIRHHPNEILVSNPTIIGTTTAPSAEFRQQQQQQHAHALQQQLQQQQQQHILTTTFNPQMHTTGGHVHGMQVQFQPVQHYTQQIMQTMPSITSQAQPQQQQPLIEQSQLINSMPPPSSFATTNASLTALQTMETPIKMNQATYQPGNSPQPVPYPQQPKPNTTIDGQTIRAGQKRKLEDDDGSIPIGQPRMGMGLNSGGNFINNQRDGQPPNGSSIISSSQAAATSTSTTTTSTPNAQDESAGDPYSSPVSNGNNKPSSPLHGGALEQQSSPSSYNNNNNIMPENRSYYQRDDGILGNMNGGAGTNIGGYQDGGGGNGGGGGQRLLLEGPLGGGGGGGQPMPSGNLRGMPRYRPGGGGGGGYRDYPYLMRPPHIPDGNFPMHRMNFGPPPPPPPSYPHRGDNAGYGPPPPSHFRGQW